MPALSPAKLLVVQDKAQQAVAVYDLSMGIRLTLGSDAVLHKIADAAMGHTQIRDVAVLLPVADGKALRVAVARGENAVRNEGKYIPFCRTISRWVERSLERCAHPAEISGTQPALPLTLSKMPGGFSVPMLAGGTFIGILHFTSKNPHRAVPSGQMRALITLAAAAATALEAAGLLEQLQSAERSYRNLAESAPDIIFRYELEPQRRFSYVNPAATSILGYSPEEHYADPNLMLKIIHSDERPLIENLLSGNPSSGGMVTLRYVHRNGSEIWIEQRSQLVHDSNGHPIAIEGIARDITECKHLEEQLRQSQKMEAIGLLTGGVAHDFNNLLTVILGYSELILSDDAPPAETVEKLSEVIVAGKQAAVLTGQLLAFGRRQLVRLRTLDINKVIESSSKMLRRIIREDIELVTTLDAGLSSIKADTGQIGQILMNLVVNATGAILEGGIITIETQNVTVDKPSLATNLAGNPGAHVMLAVSDTGCGMDSLTLTRIFEPFYTTKEAGKGTGLGLSIVYSIVKQCGGQIRVFSEPGKGTRFEILLPRTTHHQEESCDLVAFPSDGPSGPETILVVEDDVAVRGLITTILKSGGYQVLIACDGTEALQLCEQHVGQIGLVFTDLIMPGISGFALVESLRHLNRGMKTLYMSGHSDDALANPQLDPRVPFIRKPFTSAELIGKIREIFDRGIAIPAKMTAQN